MRRKIFGMSFLALILITGLFLIYHYLHSYQYLTVRPQNGIALKVFKATDDYGNYNEKSTPVASVTSDTTLKLKKEAYVVVAQQTNDYKPASVSVELSTKHEFVSLNSDYTEQKLNSLLQSEKVQINQVIATKYPAFGTNYSISTEKLYKLGEWCGVLLSAKDQNSLDDRRIILNKKGSTWVVATDPPPIIIGSPVYPDIPKEIISAVNVLP